jgi:CheY-like chemotaxis protein/HPt (histidine-containing phosphotransfer) domain-containing protein
MTSLKRAAASGEPYQLVILDSETPWVNGLGLAKRIRDDADLAGAKIVLLTSLNRGGDASPPEELGIAASLTKPTRPSDLLDAIMTAMGIASAEKVEPGPASDELPADGRRSLHILLAEDNAINQRMTTRILEKQGHSVVVADDGAQAVRAIESDEFDLVLMDVQMPIMDGYQATAGIRRDEAGTDARIPIIAMTANAMKGDRDLCLDAGMDTYIAKPIRAKDLLDMVDNAVPIEIGAPSDKVHGTGDGIDRDAALALAGDEDVLREVAALFLNAWPKAMRQIREAMALGDSEALEHAAHSMKGSVAFFSADSAAKAGSLEEIARAGDLARAGACYADLEAEIERIRPAVAAIAKESVE